MRGVALSGKSGQPEAVLTALEGTVWRGTYRILHRIHDGTLAVRYEAIHLGLGSSVEIQFLSSQLSRSQVAVHRRELAALRCLAHPNIARVIDFDEDESNVHYVVAERLSGETLEAYLARERMDFYTGVELIVAIGSALDAARRALVMHGDLDASRVVLTGTDGAVPKLVGLGVFRREGSGSRQIMTSDVVSIRENETRNLDRADQVALATLARRILAGHGSSAFNDAVSNALGSEGYRSFGDFVRELSLAALAVSGTRSQSGAFSKSSSTTTGLARVRQKWVTGEDVARAVQLCRAAWEGGDIYEAAFRAERAVQLGNEARSPLAIEVLERAFPLLERIFFTRLGGGARRLFPRRASSTWTELRISPTDGTVIALLSGGQTLDEALRRSDRPRLETLKDLASLARRGMISIE